MKDKYESYMNIYTDGSRENETLKTASGLYLPEERVAKNWRLPNNSSITTAELFAIKMAIQQAKQRERSTVIFTDSQTAAMIIGSEKPRSNVKMAYEIQRELYTINTSEKYEIHIQWIPSHRMILGNETADKIAKEGFKHENITYITPDPVTKVKTLKRKYRADWEEKQKIKIRDK